MILFSFWSNWCSFVSRNCLMNDAVFVSAEIFKLICTNCYWRYAVACVCRATYFWIHHSISHRAFKFEACSFSIMDSSVEEKEMMLDPGCLMCLLRFARLEWFTNVPPWGLWIQAKSIDEREFWVIDDWSCRWNGGSQRAIWAEDMLTEMI